jgi:hypothetical protein
LSNCMAGLSVQDQLVVKGGNKFPHRIRGVRYSSFLKEG